MFFDSARWIEDILVSIRLIEIWDSITKILNYWKSYQKVTFSVLSMHLIVPLHNVTSLISYLTPTLKNSCKPFSSHLPWKEVMKAKVCTRKFLFYYLKSMGRWQHLFDNITPMKYGMKTKIKPPEKIFSSCLEDSKTKLLAFFISNTFIWNTRLRFYSK